MSVMTISTKAQNKVNREKKMKDIWLMEELLLFMSILGVVITPQPVTDNLLLAWCLAGSVGGAMASIALWEPETSKGRIFVFLSSCLMGLLYAPSIMHYLYDNYKLIINMPNCVAISATISLFIVQIFRPLAPIVMRMLVSKFENWFGQKLDSKFGKKEDN